MKRLLLVALGLALLGCFGPEEPEYTPPPDTHLCGEMCSHLAKLGCEESQAVYDIDAPGPPDVPNVTCKTFCEKRQKRGVFVNPRCVLEVTSCEGIEPARRKDPKQCKAN